MLTPLIEACHLLGADVGKHSIAVFNTANQKSRCLPNRPAALRSYLQRHQHHILAVEATGGYEVQLIETALALGMTVLRVHARRVRADAEASGQNAKTDALDAKAIAHFAARHRSHLRPYQPPAPEDKALRQLTRRRDELLTMRTQERNRLQAPDNDLLKPSLTAVLDCLNQQIAALETAIRTLVAHTPALQHKLAILTAVPGVGAVTAANLLAALPELGSLAGKPIAALAGLAPFARNSGTKIGYRRTGRGRSEVRRILFMAALSAAHHHPSLKPFYQRLIARGKKPLLALIATARKLLTILNAKLRNAPLSQQS